MISSNSGKQGKLPRIISNRLSPMAYDNYLDSYISKGRSFDPDSGTGVTAVLRQISASYSHQAIRLQRRGSSGC